MTDVVYERVLELQRPGGFDDYFGDIIRARDIIDRPQRGLERKNPRLTLTVNPDEYDIVGGVDLDERCLTLSFGIGGLVDIAEQFTDLDISLAETDERLAVDGLRFSIVFQASQVFINNRIKLDTDFLDRFRSLMKKDSRSPVPYQREPIRYPNTLSPLRDPALQYRVGRFSSRVALDALISLPYSKTLQREPDAGNKVIKSMKKRLADEIDASVIVPEHPEEDLPLAKITYRQMNADDNYPLMWACLANPVPHGYISQIALAHIGRKNSPQPGWQPIE
jgi:hypothetical protein